MAKFYYDFEDPEGHKILEDGEVLSELTTVGEFRKLTGKLNEQNDEIIKLGKIKQIIIDLDNSEEFWDRELLTDVIVNIASVFGIDILSEGDDGLKPLSLNINVKPPVVNIDIEAEERMREQELLYKAFEDLPNPEPVMCRCNPNIKR